MIDELIAHVTQYIDVCEFYSRYIKDFDGTPGRHYSCPFHEDANPSLVINQDGSFKCFGCDAGGGGPIKFYQLVSEYGSIREAAIELYDQFVRPVVPKSILDGYRTALKKNPEIIKRLESERGWHPNVVGFLGLGLERSGDRIAIPYFNEYKLCTAVFLYNVFRTRKPDGEEYAKLTPAKPGMETGRIWPKSSLDREQIVLCEGYADCILLLSLNVAAVTIGSCTNRISARDVLALDGKEVYVVYDTDEPGREGAKDVANRLAARNVTVKIIDLPTEDENHNDITDYIVKEGHTKDNLFSVISSAPYHKVQTPELIGSRTLLYGDVSPSSTLGNKNPPFVSIQGIREAGQFCKMFMTEATVVGKATHTLLPPKKIRCKCLRVKKKCGGCRFAHAPKNTIDIDMDPEDPYLLRMFEASDARLTSICKEMLGIAQGCTLSCQQIEAYSVSKILVAPPIGATPGNEKSVEAIQVFGYAFGASVQANISYLFKGYSTAHPQDRSAVGMFLEYRPVATTLDTFDITKGIQDDLGRFKVLDGEDVYERLLEHYAHCARSITGIKERPLAHMACDLVFHSPVSFVFNGDFIRKGSLDVLIFGDSGTGKNFIADGFQAFYQHGESISGENVSPMNLIGGIKMLSKFRGLMWGRFVMRHRDTVIVDEMSAIKPENFSLLSRIRCHGIADLDKDGLHQKAEAICGIIWLSNQRDRRVMADYQFGVEVLRSLVPQHEDIRRFDYVIALAHGDVGSSVINAPGLLKETHRFDKDACHNLILWIKSRLPDQIEFTKECTTYILQEAIRFGREYSDEFPLALPENMRFKLAKIAASIAGRTFSATPDGSRLVVAERHAKAGVAFLDAVYRSDALGFKSFSDVSRAFSEFDAEALEKGMVTFAEDANMEAKDFYAMFGMQKTISFDHISSITHFEPITIRRLKNLLAKHRCILQRSPNVYEKTRGFIRFLRERL